MKLAKLFTSFAMVCAAFFAFFTPQKANAAIMASLPDVLGQVAAQGSQGWPVYCLALNDEPSEKAEARFDEGAELGMERYLSVASAGGDIGEAYKRNWSDPWSLDGEITEDRSTVSDPWASSVARIERIGTMLGQSRVFGRAIWNAFDSEGDLLGTYDAELIRRSQDYAIGRMRLFSPGKLGEAEALTPYCASPGDNLAYLEGSMKSAEKRVEKAREKLATAEARAAEKPNSKGRLRKVSRRQEKLAEREEEYRLAEMAFKEASASEEQAKAKLAELGS